MNLTMNNKLKSNSKVKSKSRRCTSMTHPMISMICVSSMLMMVMALAMSSTPVSAFLIDTTTPHALQITSHRITEATTSTLLRRKNDSRYHQQQRAKTSTTITTANTRKMSTTYLQMAITKSGGRPIQSNEQFQTEILLFTADDEQDKDTQTDGDDNDTDNSNGNDNDNVKDVDIDIDVQTKISSSTPPTPESFKPILVFYSAPWCGPCRLSNPVVKEIIRQFVPRIDVVEVCTDDLPEVAETAGVASIPTIQMYYRGELLDTIVGCVAKNVLSSAVKKILEDLGCFDDNDDDAAAANGESVLD